MNRRSEEWSEEPGRLRDESDSQLERALLGAGASYPSSSETRVKALAALGLAGSATLVAGTVSAASLSTLAKATAKATWTKVVVGVSLLSAAAVPVGYYAWKHHEAAGRAAFARTSAPAIDRERPPEAESPAPELPGSSDPLAGPVDPLAAASPSPRPAAGLAPPPSLPPPSPSSRPSLAHGAAPHVTLTQELFAVDAARAALARGDADAALALLNVYGRRHPGGRLELEAEVLRIDALALSGRGDAARRRAELFVRRYPNSVLAPRVRSHLDD